MNLEILKVGDTILERQCGNRFSFFERFTPFFWNRVKIVRFTKTLIITSSGKRIRKNGLDNDSVSLDLSLDQTELLLTHNRFVSACLRIEKNLTRVSLMKASSLRKPNLILANEVVKLTQELERKMNKLKGSK